MSSITGNLQVFRSYLRLPPMPGGMERHIASLSVAQRALGIEVINIFNSGTATGPSIQVDPGFDLRKIKRASLRNAVFYLAATAKTTGKMAGTNSVLHVHGDWNDFLCSKMLAKRLGVKAVAASVHGELRKITPALYRIAMSHCDPIFVTGKRQRDFLAGILRRTVTHMPSAPHDLFFDVDHSVVSQQNCADVIVVSNLYPVKRTDLVVACAARRPDLRFVLFGDGSERKDIEARISHERLTNIELRGQAKPDRIAAAMRRSRVFLSTSTVEGTPTAALEAMAAGLPVVLTPSNDYSWLVRDGVNGFVTKSWNVEEISACLDGCLTNEDRRKKMGVANRQIAKKHRWSTKAQLVTSRMLDVLERQMS